MSFSIRAVPSREPLDEQIRFETTRGQHEELLSMARATGSSKAQLMRAMIALGGPILRAHPDMVKTLQPGANPDHDGSEGGE